MIIRRLLATLSIASTLCGADLQPQTLRFWQSYIDSLVTAMKDRLRPGMRFLKVDENQEWAKRAQDGETVVVPGGVQSVTRVPSGLVHDWLGITFLPHATIDSVLEVMSDYDEYKDVYRPIVVESRTVARGPEDRFSMVLMNKSLLFDTALEIDYKCSANRVSERRWYGVSQSTRVQEIESYGTPDQRALPDGEGNGYVWRLASITRLEEEEGGVFIELEAVALSRDIPGCVRWFVCPIVRRISIDSLRTCLRQTAEGVKQQIAHSGFASGR